MIQYNNTDINIFKSEGQQSSSVIVILWFNPIFKPNTTYLTKVLLNKKSDSEILTTRRVN